MGIHTPSAEALYPFLEGGSCLLLCPKLIMEEVEDKSLPPPQKEEGS